MDEKVYVPIICYRCGSKIGMYRIGLGGEDLFTPVTPEMGDNTVEEEDIVLK